MKEKKYCPAAVFAAALLLCICISCEKKVAVTKDISAQNTQTEKGFRIVDYGPRDFLSAAVQNPSIFAVFSEPVIPIEELGTQSNTSEFMEINPPLKGVYRWYGTRYLSFEAAEPCKSQQIYTVRIKPSVVSFAGEKLSGNNEFSFETEQLSITKIIPGDDYSKKTGIYYTDTEVPPQAAQKVSVQFNYPVQVNDVLQYITVTDSGTVRKFKLRRAEEDRLIIDIQDKLDFTSVIAVTLKAGAKSSGSELGTREDQTYTYNTLSAFEFKHSWEPNSSGIYSNPVDLFFSHPINAKSVLKNIQTDPPMKLDETNIETSGSRLRLHNLPVTFNSVYTVKIGENLEDVYGRILGKETLCRVEVPEAESSALFLDSGSRMLESQYAQKFLFEYQNTLPDSWYRVSTVQNPFSDAEIAANKKKVFVNEKNVRLFEVLDIQPFLNNEKKGFVGFEASMQIWDRLNKRDYTLYNRLNVQVTDLGITVRIGWNNAAVLVTSLSTGKPVAGAHVHLLSINKSSAQFAKPNFKITEEPPIASGFTNKDGFVSIQIPPHAFDRAFLNTYSLPFVYVQADNDRAVFEPENHNMYRFGVPTSNATEVLKEKAYTFLFSDRGLYKPGESVLIRGVDRTLKNGVYSIYSGDYSILLSEAGWNGKKIVEVSGTASVSGGFTEKIRIPADTEPGDYELKYTRSDGAKSSGSFPVTVAYFERLKFQASITKPVTAIVSGSDINVQIQASYLSGGSLSGASFTANWHREASYFRPSTPETKNFRFGPYSVYDSRRPVSSEKGMLSAGGNAGISQKTGGESIEGAPYTYGIEAAVTDISNQSIAARRTVTVHPAQYYIGIAKPSGIAGFPQKGQKLNFDYMLATPEGKKIGDADSVAAGTRDNVTVELLRDEWRVVKQQGYNGYVYDQYIKDDVVESSTKTTLMSTGTITVTPPKAGQYTLRLSAADKSGKKVLSEYQFYVTGSDAGFWNRGNAAELRLTPDKSEYNPGETAHVLLESPLSAGTYLITTEREGIISEEVRRFDTPVSVIDLPIMATQVPVVYLTVSSYSVRSGPPSNSYGNPDLDKPKGLFGVTPIFVNPRVKSFTITIETDKKSYQPGETVRVTLKAEKTGSPVSGAELTLMAVDRGVLDLIQYHVPDPLTFFYDKYKFPLAVRGGDSRALLMDPVTYEIRNLLGGDSGENEEKMSERKDFNPTAVFEPVLITGNDGKVSCEFKLPDTLTTYRLTAFGIRDDFFALTEDEIAAQNKVNVREVLPRRLRERDVSEVGVLITNLDSKNHEVSVTLAVGNPVELLSNQRSENGLATIAGGAEIKGTTEQKVTVESGMSKVVFFEIEANKAGFISLNFTVKSSVLNERLVNELQIERPYTFETVSTTGTLTAAEPKKTEHIVIPAEADNNRGSLSLTLDATRLGLIEDAVTWLFRYPYGCLEQRSAAVLPLAVFGSNFSFFSLNSEVKNPEAVVNNEIKQWAKLQRTDGGFPYWPNGTKSNLFVSLRIAHVYAAAKENGMRLPSELKIDKLLLYIKNEYGFLTKKDRDYGGAYLQTYVQYVLSLFGEHVDTGRLAALLKDTTVGAAPLAYAGMTFANIGKKNEASQAAKKLRNLLRPTVRGVDITNPDKETTPYTFFGGNVEELALTLEFFVTQYPGDEINTRLLYSLLESKRSGGYWENTTVTVRVLSAINALINAENLKATDIKAAAALASSELFSASFKGLAAKPETKTWDFLQDPFSDLKKGTAYPLELTREGNGNLYYTLSMQYAIPSEKQTPRDEGLGVFMTIVDFENGKTVENGNLETGKIYKAEIRLSSGRDRTFMALRVPVPSGAEILDAAFATAPRIENNSDGEENPYQTHNWISNQAVYDNEIHYFWDSFYAGVTNVSFLFRTARRGKFPTPPALAECMYEPEIFGRTGGILYRIQ